MNKKSYHGNLSKKRNCGYIDNALWVGIPYNIQGFEDEEITIECPASVFYKNHNTIRYLIYLNNGNINPLELSFLENSALLEYTIAKQISETIRDDRKK